MESNKRKKGFSQTLLIVLIAFAVSSIAPVHAQTKIPEKGTPEFDCLKTWSTASEYYKNVEFKNAIPYFWKALACDKSLRPAKADRVFTTVYDKLADSYLNLNFPDSAVISYKMAYKDFNDVNYIYSIGNMFESKLSKPDSAISYYRKYYNLTKDPEELKRIAGVQISASKYEESIATYEEYLKIVPDDVGIWRYMLDSFGSFYKKFKGKDVWLKNCMAFAKNFPDEDISFFVNELLEKDIKEGNYDRALESIGLLLNSNPNNTSAYEKRGKVYENLGKYDLAMADYKKIKELKPEDATNVCRIADMQIELGKLAQAYQTANEAIKINSEFGFPYYLQGKAIVEQIRICVKQKGEQKAQDREAYQLAHARFSKAAGFFDVKANAEAQRDFCVQNFPTTEDKFYGRTGAINSDGCYGWVPK